MDNIKTDSYYIDLIKKDIEKIKKYTSNISYDEFITDELIIDAILFRLVQMIENIKKLSPDFKNNYTNIEWAEIIGFRNRIVHDYGRTDYTIVYEVVTQDITKLESIFK